MDNSSYNIKIKRGELFPGMTASIAKADLRRKNGNPKTKDTENREYVQNKIIEYIEKGLSKEKAIEEIMKDPIVKEFEYLTKNGLDIRICFKNWLDARMNPRDNRNFAR